MRTPPEIIRTVHLDHDQLLILDSGRDGRVRVLHGGVWLTESGHPGDAMLRIGDEAPVHGQRAVLQAQGATAVQLVSGRALAPAWWPRLRAWAGRWTLGPQPCPGQ